MVPSEWSGAEDQLLSVGLRQRQASKDRCSSRNTAQIMRVVWVLFADRPAVARLVSASLPFPAALLENNLIWFDFLCFYAERLFFHLDRQRHRTLGFHRVNVQLKEEQYRLFFLNKLLFPCQQQLSQVTGSHRLCVGVVSENSLVQTFFWGFSWAFSRDLFGDI